MTHRVAALLVDGAGLFESSIALEVFGVERPELGRPYELQLCARGGRATLERGIGFPTPGDLTTVAEADTVIVSHGSGTRGAHPEVVDALRVAHDRGARLVSFCTGAFTLAETGLLDGRRATTHWMVADAFRARFPRVDLDPNVLFVDEGDVLTSAGSAAGIDLALHIVRLDHGAEVATAIARDMVVPPHRDGGQAQFIAPAHRPVVDGDRLAVVLDWARAELHRDITVMDMAARAAMSRRTFARRFKETTGTTPLRWLLSQRLERAQQLLETTTLDMEQIAGHAGFGAAANLRERFRTELGTTPSAYRRAFQGDAARHRQAV